MTSISRQINNTVPHMSPIGPTGTNESGAGLGVTFFNGTGLSGGTGTIKNKWTRDQEELLAKWADKALCYRWLHDLSERKFNSLNNKIQIPVIILSTLTGAVNVGINSIFPPNLVTYGSFGLGAISISTGILTTIGNFLRFAQNMEGHRVASLQWSKFHRCISAELAIHPDQRQDSVEFFTIKRAELDRLVESAPQIPSDIIAKFEERFKDVNIDKPEICDILEPTYIFEPGKKRVRIERKKKTLGEKFFGVFSSSKNDETNAATGSGSGISNDHNFTSVNVPNHSHDINTDDESIVTFNNDSNKGSPNHKKMTSPTSFADAAANATTQILSVSTGKKQDEDVEKGLKKILDDKKTNKTDKTDSELSNKLHASILESLNR